MSQRINELTLKSWKNVDGFNLTLMESRCGLIEELR